MKGAAIWLAVGALLCGSCRKPVTKGSEADPALEATAGVSVTIAPITSASASTGPLLARQRVNEVVAPGLRIESGVLDDAAQWGFSDLALETQHTRLGIALAKGGAQLADLLPPGALAVVNGGYFEPNFKPTTWVVDAGVQLAPKADTAKGGVLALGPGGVYVGPFSGLGFAPQLAVQSFPLVVEAEGKPGIYRDDGRRAARTLACLVDSSLHFIVISAARGDGPTLFETATLLRAARPLGFGCRRALNLDGGPSSGVWFAPELGAKQRPAFAKVGYAIVVWAR